MVFLMVPNLSKILKSGFKPLKVHTFGKFFQKSCESGVFDFCWSGPQFVQNIKPIRQLLCTFSSCSDLGIYIIYNIYKFQENQRTKNRSLHFHFHSLTSLTHFTTSACAPGLRPLGPWVCKRWRSLARRYGFGG